MEDSGRQKVPNMNTKLDLKEKISIGSKRAIVVVMVTAAVAVFFNVFANQLLNIDTVVSFTIYGGIPFIMSFILATRDERFLKDFQEGMKWFLLFFAAFTGVQYWRNGFTLYDDRTFAWSSTFSALVMSPLSFAFGVIRSHTSLHDLAAPGSGILGGLSKLEHPNKKLLTSMLWVGVVVAFAIRIAIKQTTGE